MFFNFCNIKWNSYVLEYYKRVDLDIRTTSNIQIRNKITISFSSSELRATSIKVSVVREKFDNNQWVSDGYSDGLARKIEDLILTRARELRSKNS